jgi:hypothetical protein
MLCIVNLNKNSLNCICKNINVLYVDMCMIRKKEIRTVEYPLELLSKTYPMTGNALFVVFPNLILFYSNFNSFDKMFNQKKIWDAQDAELKT